MTNLQLEERMHKQDFEKKHDFNSLSDLLDIGQKVSENFMP
jgi:hypothetical protein